MKSLTLSNHLSEIDQIRSFLKTALEGRRVSEELFYWIELSVIEICVNVIRYAYPEGEGRFTISSRLEDDNLSFIIEDSGIPFDPSASQPPDLEEIIKTRRKGGFGIYLARKLMDEFSYERRGNRNILTMSKNLKE